MLDIFFPLTWDIFIFFSLSLSYFPIKYTFYYYSVFPAKS
ncbi:hypothetical protein EUBHAL_02968 [Anaerobutyricum hallii DSM 3353]|uniref:Uncharacterized protein n=1 Tax=Anaerobutyricum hallii DSM 3353 TaxID=411469 RepID=C0EZV7_9FIRM|nr:hypothetical protein EUBHAL_02968 [Anaerobutyricum hallii DSM 3353]